MAVPTSVNDLSTTVGSNSPAGTDAITSSTGPDDYLRALASIIKHECATTESVAGTDTYTATVTPAITAYATGLRVTGKFTNANTATAPTLNLNSVGAKTIFKGVGATAMVAEDIAASGVYQFIYDATLNSAAGGWLILNPAIPTIPTPFTLGAVSVTATGTELNYSSGVTSAIQTQLNNKAPLTTGSEGVGSHAIFVHNTENTAITAGTLYSGAVLGRVGLSVNVASGAVSVGFTGTSPSGTWRALTGAVAFGAGTKSAAVFQREV